MPNKSTWAAARMHQIFRGRSSRARPFTHISVITSFDTESAANVFLERLQFAMQGGAIKSVGYTVAGARCTRNFDPFTPDPGHRSLPCVADVTRPPSTLARYGIRVRFLDATTAGKNESVTMARLGFCDTWTASKKLATLRVGEHNLARLRRRARGRDGAQLLATGPSLANVNLDDALRDETLRIVCNSIVSNPELMQAARPDVVAFADPAFHFGDNAYAKTFRRDLASCLEANPQLFAIFPAECSAPMAPVIQKYGDQVIPVPMAWPWMSSPGLLENAGLGLRTGNIMTALMLPVAAMVGGRIELFGFDGRAPDDEGFWKHNSQVQYDDLYQSVRDRHPAFFSDVDYAAYYRDHCERVAIALTQLERAGHTVLTKTPSHIPALKCRESTHG